MSQALYMMLRRLGITFEKFLWNMAKRMPLLETTELFIPFFTFLV
jgi:hypothetical protein